MCIRDWDILEESVSLHSQRKVTFRDYFEYFLLGHKYLKNQPFGGWLWFNILIIPKG